MGIRLRDWVFWSALWWMLDRSVLAVQTPNAKEAWQTVLGRLVKLPPGKSKTKNPLNYLMGCFVTKCGTTYIAILTASSVPLSWNPWMVQGSAADKRQKAMLEGDQFVHSLPLTLIDVLRRFSMTRYNVRWHQRQNLGDRALRGKMPKGIMTRIWVIIQLANCYRNTQLLNNIIINQ